MGRQLFYYQTPNLKTWGWDSNLPRLICTPIFVLFQKQTKGMGQKTKTKPTSTPSIENAYLSIHHPVYISISKFKLMYAILPLKQSVTFFYFDDKITMNSLKIPLIWLVFRKITRWAQINTSIATICILKAGQTPKPALNTPCLWFDQHTAICIGQ